jgi:hypothetical protein
MTKGDFNGILIIIALLGVALFACCSESKYKREYQVYDTLNKLIKTYDWVDCSFSEEERTISCSSTDTVYYIKDGFSVRVVKIPVKDGK